MTAAPSVADQSLTGRLIRGRSQAVATWLAIAVGWLGGHRFYLRGWRDAIGWLHPLPAIAGAYGFWRMRTYGVDDVRGNALVPLLGIVVSAAMLQAIVLGLMSDDAWQTRFGASRRAEPPKWTTIVAVIAALAFGAIAAIATISLVGQRAFEAAQPAPTGQVKSDKLSQ